jgi:energy-coupling factor transport system substrate-specific component
MFTTPRLVLIALCAALNVAVGSIVYLLKLPIYLDSIGIILCALLLASDRWAGFVCASVAGTISCVIIFLLVNPFFIWFELTVIAIALVSVLLTARFADTLRARPLPNVKFAAIVVVCGVVTGVISAIVSAPVVAYLFGGVTGSGSAFVVAFFLKTGQQLLNATLLSGLTADPIDKVLQVLFAALLYRATPADFIAMLAAREATSATSAAR